MTLASRAQVKKDTARRVSVIRDTTLCKGMRIPRLSTAHGHDHADAQAQVSTESPCGFASRSLQLVIQLVLVKCVGSGNLIERVASLVLRFVDVSVPWHAEQMHLGEWQALETLEVLKHLDDAVDGRNTAQATAANRRALIVEDSDVEAEDRVHAEVEDVGGIVPDEEAAGANAEDFASAQRSQDLTFEQSERKHVAEASGRPKDSHKAMENVAKRF